MSAGKFQSFNATFAAKYAALTAPIEYRVDSKGRKVRLPNADRPVTTEETVLLLKYMRAIEEEEVLEALGKGAMEYMVKAGQLVRDAACPTRLWISKKCAEAYRLPAYLGPRTFIY
jgi:hypothetical protein